MYMYITILIRRKAQRIILLGEAGQLPLAGRDLWRPYPSNIAKVLGATLPESLNRTENAAARQKLAELRRMLERKGC